MTTIVPIPQPFPRTHLTRQDVITLHEQRERKPHPIHLHHDPRKEEFVPQVPCYERGDLP